MHSKGLWLVVNSSWREALRPPRRSSGQSLVEFALILPMLFLLILNTVNFGGFIFAWITIAGGARTGAQYLTMGAASVGAPTTPTAAQITTLVAADISALLNRASLVVRVCTNDNGTVACTGTGTQPPPADPEPADYVLGSIDVTYTYQPFIPAWDFPKLGIHLTLPATTIHQRAVMRMQQ
ncbi:MAG: TadE/TadG family type IV pilus assembly protein [Bryobacteraceae bacterium]